MSENEETPTDAPEPAPAPKRNLRDRFAGTGEHLRGTRGLVAATLAALIVGGLGGAAIHAAVDGEGDRHERGRFFHGERPGPPRDFRHGPGGVPGELPPTTVPTPEDEETAPTPSPSESSAS